MEPDELDAEDPGIGRQRHLLGDIPAPADSPRALADLYQLPFVQLREESIDKEAVDAFPLEVLERARALPIRLEDERVKVAIADPGNVQVVDDLRLAARYPVDLVVAAPDEIDFELTRLTQGREFSARAALIDSNEPLEEPETIDLALDDGTSEAPPIRLVNSIILQAADEGASDIHFLPQGDALLVRVRIDGLLHDLERIPKRHAAGMVARVKVLANLDIAEHRQPQDGRISLHTKMSDRLLDVRVAVLPTVNGEGVIMRLLDKSRSAPTLTEIGLSNEMQMALEQMLHKASGAFLVTGPTGSGKTTTLYAALADVVRPEINVITVEDPVEYRLPDTYQVQINTRAGLTFAAALRSILRSDPDVLMVGEIRDLETAKITLEAALTGHVVLSTMHANEAPGAIARLNDMGVEPFVTGSALTAVLAQRLVRRLCHVCREPYEASANELLELGFPPEQRGTGSLVLYRRRGCQHCIKGYRGRTAVYQLMELNDRLSRLAAERATLEQLFQAAREGGMVTLWEDGLAKAAAGLTTIDELYRVLR